ncbi:response regulator [Pseudoalteromonas atlantica]|uniref:response regulator n=1 Tax=Pseudoalteromonas atlantica TaxID=288 RepID=UPI00373579C8
MKIKVMIVDDQTLVRSGIKSLLMLSEAIDVVAEASDGEQAISLIQEKQPDVVLMDIRMPAMSGIDTLRALNQTKLDKPQPPVIMLTTFNDHELVVSALQAGAKGYLLKDVSLETLVDAIECVHKGETLIQPAISERVIKQLSTSDSQFESVVDLPEFSAKELEILRFMAAGCSNREISAAVFKSEGTVKNYVSTILAKLGVRDRTRAVLKAIEVGFIK